MNVSISEKKVKKKKKTYVVAVTLGGRCQWCWRGKVMVVVVVGGQIQCIERPRSREKIVCRVSWWMWNSAEFGICQKVERYTVVTSNLPSIQGAIGWIQDCLLRPHFQSSKQRIAWYNNNTWSRNGQYWVNFTQVLTIRINGINEIILIWLFMIGTLACSPKVFIPDLYFKALRQM